MDAQHDPFSRKRRHLSSAKGKRKKRRGSTPSFVMPKARRKARAEVGAVGGARSTRERIRREALEHNRSLLAEQHRDAETDPIAEIAKLRKELGARRPGAPGIDEFGGDDDEAVLSEDILGGEEDDSSLGGDIPPEQAALFRAMLARPEPWIDSCVELDEMRERIPPAPLEISVPNVGAHADEEPSMDGVVCQIQNWVVRLDCVIETLSVQKALRQATRDREERHGLRRWARAMGFDAAAPCPDQYDVWYLKRLAQRNAVHDWTEVMRLHPELRRQGVPVWSRNATHVADLAQRIANGGPGPRIGPELTRRPALNLHNLVYSVLPVGGRYDTNNFSALKCPNMSPRATCLIYSSPRAQRLTQASARAVCTGAKTPDEVSWSLHKLMRTMEEGGSLPLTVDWRTYKVSNVVASVILISYTVNLRELDRQCGMQCSYNPAMFPAAILRLRQDLGRVAVLVYSTKLVIAGSKSKKILERTLRTAIRVTWRARHKNLKGEGARAMLRPHERVFKELLADRRRGMPADATAWGIAIQGSRGGGAKKKGVQE